MHILALAGRPLLCAAFCLFSLCGEAAVAPQTSTPSNPPPKPVPCAKRAEKRQFDFWVGEWAVQTPDGNPAGDSSVQLILDRCVVFENWRGKKGYNGKSL